MDSDIKDQFYKIINLLEDMKRVNFYELKRKLEDLDEIKRKLQDADSSSREIKDLLREIKSRLEILESKIQK